MANWDKLNKEFDIILDGITDDEWNEFKTMIDKKRAKKQRLCIRKQKAHIVNTLARTAKLTL